MNERSIFMEALAKETPLERSVYLTEACGGDTALRQRVEALLASHEDAGDFLKKPVPERLAENLATPKGSEQPRGAPAQAEDCRAPFGEETRGPQPSAEGLDSRIGSYKLLQEIGEGGMGTVYMAQQTEPVKRLVALKLIKPGMDSKQVLARFEAERQALALMDHPHIAKVLDGGTTAPGRPFFVMELVKGVPLTRYCDEHRLTPKLRLELFIPVCQAIQHAHQKGIIHRDIKPSNVLVALYDGKPVPKVIDFGVAKAAGLQLTERTLITGFGAVVGTLEYMSPEQAELNQLDIDTHSDIYSLGVLLYELLTGSTPLDKKRLKDAAFVELLRVIREEEPQKPSTRLSHSTDSLPSVSAQRQMEPAKLMKLVRGELDWIVMKALEKDRNRRYETASAFAADVQRYLHDEPVLACPPSAWYRFAKFVQRNKAALWTSVGVSLVLLLAACGVGWALWERAAQREAHRTEVAKRVAETERTVSHSLGRAEDLRAQAARMPSATSQQAKEALEVWRQADDALAQAEAALNTGVADDNLRQRVAAVRTQLTEGRQQSEHWRARALRKEKLFRDLDEARMARSVVVGDQLDNVGAARKFEAAFEDYGLGRKADYGLDATADQIKELGRRIRAEDPDVRDALLVALDDWAYAALKAPKEWSAAGLMTIAQMADDDTWRNECRFVRHKAQLGKYFQAAELRKLSAAAQRLSLPPSSLGLLAMSLHWVEEYDEALALLRWGRRCHPTDFWMHLYLGTFLLEKKGATPVEFEEATGCFLAALALRPATSVVYSGLGNAFKAKGQVDEAIHAYHDAIRFDANFAGAHYDLGLALMDKKQWDKAITEYRMAIGLGFKQAMAHNSLGVALQADNQLDEAIDEYRTAIDFDDQFAMPHTNLGLALKAKGLSDEAMAEYRKAIGLDDKDAKPHYCLAIALKEKGELDAAIREYREFIRLDPKEATAHYNLANLLRDMNRTDEAIKEYRAAIAINDKLAEAHYNLAKALQTKKQFDEAIDEYRKAMTLGLKDARAHRDLGTALYANNQLDEAIAEFREAIDIDDKLADAYNDLGLALMDKKQWDKAIPEFRKAIALDDKFAEAHFNLGIALQAKNRLDEAIVEYRKAIDLNPNDAQAHHNLGVVLLAKNQLDEAIAEFRKAINLDRNFAAAHYNLGIALMDKKHLDEAIAEFRKAIELNPKFVEAHGSLGQALLAKGRFAEAKISTQRALELLPEKHPLRPLVLRQLQWCNRLLALEEKLPEVLAGLVQPANNRERLDLIEVCRLQSRHVAAAKLYADAFAADAELADELKATHRCKAACCAVLVAAGQGVGADQLNDMERTQLRKQALDWLRADLNLWEKRLDGDKAEDRQATRNALQHWQKHADLASVRDAEGLKKLPAEEQEVWRKLWADVNALLQKANAAK
jgi:tetratricopeptide (TPR) repeat protein